jgi:hypothetical protein
MDEEKIKATLLKKNQEAFGQAFEKLGKHLHLMHEFFQMNGISLSQALTVCVNYLLAVGEGMKLTKQEMIALMDQVKDAIHENWKEK